MTTTIPRTSLVAAIGLGLASLGGCAGTPTGDAPQVSTLDRSIAQSRFCDDNATTLDRMRARHVRTIVTRDDLLRTGEIDLGAAFNSAARTIPDTRLLNRDDCG